MSGTGRPIALFFDREEVPPGTEHKLPRFTRTALFLVDTISAHVHPSIFLSILLPRHS